jgi:hypothetical protein
MPTTTVIETPEATPFAGPPLFGTPLTVSPLAYPMASTSGTVSYTQSYDIKRDPCRAAQRRREADFPCC